MHGAKATPGEKLRCTGSLVLLLLTTKNALTGRISGTRGRKYTTGIPVNTTPGHRTSSGAHVWAALSQKKCRLRLIRNNRSGNLVRPLPVAMTLGGLAPTCCQHINAYHTPALAAETLSRHVRKENLQQGPLLRLLILDKLILKSIVLRSGTPAGWSCFCNENWALSVPKKLVATLQT